jgi:DNA recombination protein RmuC
MVIIGLLALIGILQLVLLGRKGRVDPAQLQGVERSLERTERSVRAEIAQSRDQAALGARQSREELAATLNGAVATLNAQLIKLFQIFGDGIKGTMADHTAMQKLQLGSFAAQLQRLTDSNEQKLTGVQEVLERRLAGLQEDNARQLDQMRATVDEKLQGTLERRLGESFSQVSERLEQVAKGLGEMQTLATGVGDLKKVLTNVKTRGTWGEVQLGNLLEQVLSPEQYEANVAPRDGAERVEYAVKLPGRTGNPEEVVWLPIDAKFPSEDYQRLMEAQDRADAAAAEAAIAQLEARIRQCAKDIHDKYLNPPRTTDFAILFLPTEGLFAEVIRRTALVELLQNQYRVVVAGPTTLWSILSSLQMGFRTLAIQKRSSEVWTTLAAVKTEWTKYGAVLSKVQKKLQEASNSMDDAARRNRAVGRTLREVHALPAAEAATLLTLDPAPAMGEDDAEAEVPD